MKSRRMQPLYCIFLYGKWSVPPFPILLHVFREVIGSSEWLFLYGHHCTKDSCFRPVSLSSAGIIELAWIVLISLFWRLRYYCMVARLQVSNSGLDPMVDLPFCRRWGVGWRTCLDQAMHGLQPFGLLGALPCHLPFVPRPFHQHDDVTGSRRFHRAYSSPTNFYDSQTAIKTAKWLALQ